MRQTCEYSLENPQISKNLHICMTKDDNLESKTNRKRGGKGRPRQREIERTKSIS